MNGSHGAAFSASLLRNDSPSVIVTERWEREDLYLFFSFLLLLLSVVRQLYLFSHPRSLPGVLSMPLCRSPHVTASLCWSGGWEEREEGNEGEGKGGC